MPNGIIARMERRLGPYPFLWFVLGAAALLRFIDLSGLPPAHYRDVATTATDALRAASGHPRLHFTYDEGLYADLMGLVFLILGPSDWTVRAPGALFGILTCFGVYRLGKSLGQDRAGLLGAALLAVTFWHVLLSRSGFRAVLLPCLLVHAAACLVEGLQGKGTWRLLLGGALFGLGIHVYPAFRFAPLFLPAYLLVEWSKTRDGHGRMPRNLLLFGGAALAVAAPMLLHYARHPEHFNFPHRVLSVFSPKVPGEEIPGHLAANLKATLLMFHVSGDANWRHNLSGAPMLDPLTGLLFLLGLVVVWKRPAPVPALLVGWIGAMLLPNMLSVEGVPHGLRSSGVLPAVALLAGIGIESVLGFLGRRGRIGERALIGAGIAVVLLAGGWTAYRYFVVWGNSPQMAEAHDLAFKSAARVLRDAPAGVERFLIANGTGFEVNGHPVEAEAYLFELRDRPPVLLGPKDAARLVVSGRPALVALIQRDDRILGILRQLNPQAPIVEVSGPGLSPGSPVFRVN